MDTRLTRWLAAALIPMFGGCAIMGSPANPIAGHAERVGLPYMVPKALLPVQVVDSGGAVRVDVLARVLVGDPTKSFLLRHHLSPFGNDTIKVEVDPTTSLLKTVDLRAEDKTGDVLKKLAGLVFRSESAPGDRVVYSGMLDPSNSASVDQANADIGATLSKVGLDCKPLTDARCEAYQRVRENAGTFDLKLDQIGAPPSNAPPANPPDCSIGVCHRGNVPYHLTVKLMGEAKTIVVPLPNHAPVVVVPLARQPFVAVTHKATLKDGMLESYEATKPSSALAIASWPVEALDAILEATSKVVQFTIGTNAKELELERARLDHEKAMLALEEERKTLNSRPESAVSQLPAILSVGTRLTNVLPASPPFEVPAMPTPPGVGAPPTAGPGPLHPDSDGTLKP